jgi:hypothetical protein
MTAKAEIISTCQGRKDNIIHRLITARPHPPNPSSVSTKSARHSLRFDVNKAALAREVKPRVVLQLPGWLRVISSSPLPSSPVFPSCIFTIRFLYPSCNVPVTSSSFAYPFPRLPSSVGRTRPLPPKPSCHHPQAVPPPSLGLSERETVRCQVGCRVWREPCWGWQERGGGVWCSSLWVG